VWIVPKQKWQKDYEKPGELVQYYTSTQRKLYGKGYPNPLKTFMGTASPYFEQAVLASHRTWCSWELF
jgi:hypothetical protein